MLDNLKVKIAVKQFQMDVTNRNRILPSSGLSLMFFRVSPWPRLSQICFLPFPLPRRGRGRCRAAALTFSAKILSPWRMQVYTPPIRVLLTCVHTAVSMTFARESRARIRRYSSPVRYCVKESLRRGSFNLEKTKARVNCRAYIRKRESCTDRNRGADKSL